MKSISAGLVAILVTGAALGADAPTTRPILAFPGAEGAAAYATGGRFGSVYRVTNLNASGPGSLADAVSQPNRIVVFTVSGIIDLADAKKGKAGKIDMDQPHVTIAGQTAPGEGICIVHGALQIHAGDVIVRHLRSRRGFVREGDSGDAIEVKPRNSEQEKTGQGYPPGVMEKVKEKKEERGKGDKMKEPVRIENILLDHLSASWATDENLTLTHADKTTAQFCIAAEGLDYANPKQTPPNHSEGSLWGVSVADGRSTIHHTLYAHNRLRNPRTTGGSLPPPVLDFTNNVVYDCSEYTSHTGNEAVHVNWINNYYKAGPSTPAEMRPVMFTFRNSIENRMYAAGNVIVGFEAETRDNWRAVRFEKGLTRGDVGRLRVERPFETTAVRREAAGAAYETVLAEAGATLPSRDSVDYRILESVRRGVGRVINKETDLPAEERWPDYHSLPAPVDADRDGIPDDWERQFGLDPADPSDAMNIATGGYANIEHYVNNTDPTGGRTPIVFISATVSRADSTNGQPGELQISRAGDDASELSVKVRVEGTAAGGKDYAALSSMVTVPRGQRSIRLSIVPQTGAGDRAGRTVIVVLEPAQGGYHVGCPSAAMVVFRH